MVLGKLPVPGRPTFLMIVGQGPIALTVGAGGGLFGHFYSPLSFHSSFSLSLWETARYRLKYCLKGLLNPKQPTNQRVASGVSKDITLRDVAERGPSPIAVSHGMVVERTRKIMI